MKQTRTQNPPLISVIVPIYNVATYLPACIESVQNQTYTNLEIILVNDGSTDTSWKICERMTRGDGRVKRISQKNKGVSAARNMGLKHANGDYVLFVDSDDIVSKYIVEELVKLVKETNADIAVSAFQGFTSVAQTDSLDVKSGVSETKILGNAQAIDDMLYEKDLYGAPFAKLFRKQVISGLRFDTNIAYAEDLKYCVEAMSRAKTLAITSKKMYYYRQNPTGAIARRFSISRLSSIQALNDISQIVGSQHKKALDSRRLTEGLYILTTIVKTPGKRNMRGVASAWQLIKKSRVSVVLNQYASTRSRAYALASFFGAQPLLWVIGNRAKHGMHKKQQIKKVLVRYYAAQNLGDDLFVALFAARFQDNLKVVAMMRQCKTQFATYENVQVISKRYVLLFAEKLGYLLKVSPLTYIVYAVRSDVLVYIGGSIFIEGEDINIWQRERRLYRFMPAPYYILGSNIGPYKSQKFMPIVRDIMNGAADVCLRDRASYELVKDLPNTRLATDIAFTLDTSKYKIESKKRVVFSLVDCRSRFSEAIADRYEKAVAHMTERFLKKGYEVIYMSFCKFEGDEVANENAICRLPSKLRTKIVTYNYSGDIEEALQILASSSIVVATRFHATILGLVFGKKVLPIAYSDKTLNILSDMHFPGPVIDIRDIEKSDIHRLNFESIPTMDVAVLKSLAETQFQELDKVLTRRADV